MKRPLAHTVSLLAVCCHLAAHADVTTNLDPVADAYILQLNPDLNTGTDTDLIAGEIGPRGGNDVRRGLLRFDLSGSIPAGSTVNSVTLQVNVVKVPRFPVNSTFDVRRLLHSWTELGV